MPRVLASILRQSPKMFGSRIGPKTCPAGTRSIGALNLCNSFFVRVAVAIEIPPIIDFYNLLSTMRKMPSVFQLRKRQRLRCDLDHIPGPAQTHGRASG